MASARVSTARLVQAWREEKRAEQEVISPFLKIGDCCVARVPKRLFDDSTGQKSYVRPFFVAGIYRDQDSKKIVALDLLYATTQVKSSRPWDLCLSGEQIVRFGESEKSGMQLSGVRFVTDDFWIAGSKGIESRGYIIRSEGNRLSKDIFPDLLSRWAVSVFCPRRRIFSYDLPDAFQNSRNSIVRTGFTFSQIPGYVRDLDVWTPFFQGEGRDRLFFEQNPEPPLGFSQQEVDWIANWALESYRLCKQRRRLVSYPEPGTYPDWPDPGTCPQLQTNERKGTFNASSQGSQRLGRSFPMPGSGPASGSHPAVHPR